MEFKKVTLMPGVDFIGQIIANGVGRVQRAATGVAPTGDSIVDCILPRTLCCSGANLQ